MKKKKKRREREREITTLRTSSMGLPDCPSRLRLRLHKKALEII
jgi:hypothetical protein